MSAERPAPPETQSPSVERLPDVNSFFPTPEDWVDIQGGMPRVFRHPSRPQAKWIVLHVYDEQDSYKDRFKSGLVVDTMPPEGGNFKFSRKTFSHFEADNPANPIQRDVVIPSFMDRQFHGDPCERHSSAVGSREGYDRIKNQSDYEVYINRLQAQGWQEMRFARKRDKNDSDRVIGFQMVPNAKIRNPRPLKTDS